MNNVNPALLDAIRTVSSRPAPSRDGGAADEVLCCPKCHYRGPAEEFNDKDEGLSESDSDVRSADQGEVEE